MAIVEQQDVRIVEGEIVGGGDWVYVWMDAVGVVHVGSTALDPSVRTWLHLHDDDPEIGRIRAQRPDLLTSDSTVRAFRLRPGIDRRSVRDAVRDLLDSGAIPATDEIGSAAQEIVARIESR